MKGTTASRLARGVTLGLALLGWIVLPASESEAIKVIAATVDRSTDAGATWTTGVTAGTPMYTGDWVRVNLELENDTGLLGNAIADQGAACPPAPRTCPPAPPTPTSIAINDSDCASNNDWTKGEWPAQYWVWPFTPSPAASGGYYPDNTKAPMSLVSASNITTFAYNGYSYSGGGLHDTSTVSWTFRLDQAASAIDLDVFATDQDDNPGCFFYAPAEGSWHDNGGAAQGDGTATGALASLWGGTLAALAPVSVAATAYAVVGGSETRPTGVVFIGDTVEVRADVTNITAAVVTVSPGQACLSSAKSGSICVHPINGTVSCLAGFTDPGSPAGSVSINPGNTAQFRWTESVSGAQGCSTLGGCTTGGRGSGSVGWTPTVATAQDTVAVSVQPAPLEITATVFVDPDGAAVFYPALPLGVLSPGSSQASAFYYNGRDVLETRFTYRNTSGHTFTIRPELVMGSGANGVEPVSGPVPAGVQTLDPGASVTVSWTWKRRTGGTLEGCTQLPSDLEFTTAARGNCLTQSVKAIDHPFHPYGSCPGGCLPVGSQALTFAVPEKVKTGLFIPVSLNVRNTDSRPFVLDPAVVPWHLYTPNGGTASLSESPPAPPYAWDAGKTLAFTWTYTADTSGEVDFEAGIEAGAITPPCYGACLENPPYCDSLKAKVLIQDAGVLEITSFTADPAVACAEMEGALVLQMGLKNNGTDCIRVKSFCSQGYPDPTPTGNAWDAASPPAPSASPSPAVPFTIPAGGTQLVTWYMRTLCPYPTDGKIWFNCASTMVNAETYNCGTGTVIDPAVGGDWLGAALPPVTMTQPAKLAASIWTDKGQYSTGQVITVYLSVSNEGGNTLNPFAVTLTPATTAGGSVAQVAGPVPVPPATYPGSGQCLSVAPYASNGTFVWQFTALAGGFVKFTAKAEGTDTVCPGSGLSLSVETPRIGIATGAGLECTVLAGPTVVTMQADCPTCPLSSGCDPATGAGCLDVVMLASNAGGIDLANVTVSQASDVPAACVLGTCPITGAATVACPAPGCEPAEAAIPSSLAAGSSHQYLWRFSPTALGCVRSHVGISGQDAATGAPLLQHAWGPCVSIVPRYPVELKIVSAPAQVAPGQVFSMTVRVFNPGETPVTLQGGQPALQFKMGGSAVTDQYSVVPVSPGVIPAGESRDVVVEVTVRRDATPGVVVATVPEGTQYIVLDAATNVPVKAVARGDPSSILVSDPRSKLVVAGPHPVRILSAPALLEYVVADAGRGNGRTTLKIYTLSGELVRTLVDKTAVIENATVPWDGRNSSGQVCAAGVYLARLEAPGYSTTIKVAIVK